MNFSTLFFATALAFSFYPTARAAESRSDTLLSGNWRFVRADVGDAADPAFLDDNWTSVTIPHTWNSQDGQAGGDYYRGPGWYRRTFEVPAQFIGRRVFLRFEAASTVADVYVNGQFVGEHRGGFGAFCFEITGFLKFGPPNEIVQSGAPNVLAVRVDNAWRGDLAPLSGDFTVFGGLYRPVHLIVTDRLCLSPLDHGSSGVTLLPANISERSADVAIETLVSNGDATARDATLVATILDAAGQSVATNSEAVSVPPGITAQETQRMVVAHPHRWNGRADPYLYRVVVELRHGDTVIDRIEQPLGLRTFRIDQTGFYLNGKPCRLRGVAIHQDRFDQGWALTDADQKEDLDLALEMGANAVRAVHYQHSETFYRLCDEAGLLVWAELPQVNFVGGSAFAENSRSQLLDLIRQNINHPCIFTWSLANELRQPSADPDPILLDLDKLAHAEDPTRPTAEAAYINIWPSVNKIPDLLGLNLYPGWYHGLLNSPDRGDFNAMGVTLDHCADWGRGQGVCVSEYGAGACIDQHEAHPSQPNPNGPWHPEEWEAIVHEHDWAAIRARPFVWGSFIWNLFDFASARRREGSTPGRNDKGLVTYDRKVCKDAYYFYKANWSDQPFVYLTDRRFINRTEALADVKVYSNCDRVELTVNGLSRGVRAGDDEHIFRWTGLALQPGKNLLTATAYRDGRPYADKCTWMLNPGPQAK